MKTKKQRWLDFEVAKSWTQSRSFVSMRAFRDFNFLPENIPRNPHFVYRNTGWKDWYDFLGKPRPKRRKSQKGWRTFESARSWARELNLKSESEWRKFRKTSCLPNDIPTNPNREYAKTGWSSWSDFRNSQHQIFRFMLAIL